MGTSWSQNKASCSSYPRSDGASSIDGGHMESCVRWISWDLVDFCVRWCGFRLVVSSYLQLSTLAMVGGLNTFVYYNKLFYDVFFRWWRDDDGVASSARTSLCSRC
jgi:hypothetical protein